MENITLNQLVYRIIGLYRAAHKTSDDIPSNRMIKDWIHSTRAMLLKQRLEKPMAVIDDQITQTISPVPLEDVDSSTLELESSGRKMLRTKDIIPPTINRKGLIGTFKRIGPIDRLEKRYRVVSHETALTSGNGKFNKKDIYAFPLDNKIYLIARDLSPKEKLDIRGVFQNPEQIPNFSDDGPYPINRELVDDLERIIVQTKFPTTLVGYKDTVADDTDNLVQTTQRQQQ